MLSEFYHNYDFILEDELGGGPSAIRGDNNPESTSSTPFAPIDITIHDMMILYLYKIYSGDTTNYVLLSDFINDLRNGL